MLITFFIKHFPEQGSQKNKTLKAIKLLSKTCCKEINFRFQQYYRNVLDLKCYKIVFKCFKIAKKPFFKLSYDTLSYYYHEFGWESSTLNKCFF